MLISILIPCYNAKNSIIQTVNSALSQDYQNIEIIINDDCSKDETFELLKTEFGNHAQISLYRNSKNLGMCGNWNVLFSLAKGEYWLKLDADDLIANNFISTCVKYAIKTKADFVGTSYRFLNTNSNESTPVSYHKKFKEGFLKFPLKEIFVNYPFHLCFTLLKADFVKKISYDGHYFMKTEVGDAEFQIRAALNQDFKAYFIPKEMGFYCFHGNNSSLTPLKQAKSFLYDVVAKHHIKLKEILKDDYKKKMRGTFKNYLKDMLLNRAPWDLKLLYTCLKYSFY